MSAVKAEAFIQELIDNEDFQIETLTLIKNMIGTFDGLKGTMNEDDVITLALPAANQLGYECTNEELAQAYITVSKKMGKFKMLGFKTGLIKNAMKVNDSDQADI